MCAGFGDVDDSSPSDSPSPTSILDQNEKREAMKRNLYAQCAACDRGFGASSFNRQEIDELVSQVSLLCPISTPSLGLVPNVASGNDDVPLEGAWRMIYTSAYDVLSISASPFTLLQSIYQVIDRSGDSVNIIDIAPRFQPLLPLNLVGQGTTLRLRVFTKAYARSANRIGLAFKRVEAKPISFAGFDASILPPFTTNLISPLQSFGISGENGEKGPGFFDILYLDQDTLIIRQNEPGGIFISTRSGENHTGLLT
jgi:hypothetical protein